MGKMGNYISEEELWAISIAISAMCKVLVEECEDEDLDKAIDILTDLERRNNMRIEIKGVDELLCHL